ncbi:SelT/SelW/SelH family protein [Polaribacter sp. Asnod1-A03]|uniref:SelT/SelW/SelH family protein n=1 Tax=Polaribacter sp. Asnod1-A03 TaxID=3160581 RepID=UPI00386E1030
MENKIRIEYCTQCNWLLRATWMSQELLTTFNTEINSLTLTPVTGGVYNIYANDILIWSRKEKSGFPEITILKQLTRDVIAPDRNLGHIDRKKK